MSRELVEREVLTPAQIDAIIDALNFCLADDWDEDSHSQSPAVYERALEKMQGLHGRVVKGNLRVALDEANAAFHAADRLARNAEARYAELQTKNKELKGDGGEAVPEGMVLVPREPTEVMIRAARVPDDRIATAIWSAMIAASSPIGEDQ